MDGVKWDRYHVREYSEESLFEMLSPIFPNTQVRAFSPKIFYDSYRITKFGFNLLYLIGEFTKHASKGWFSYDVVLNIPFLGIGGDYLTPGS